MPKSITIRDIDDHVRDELAARAALSGKSLQEYLKTQLSELAKRPDPNALLSRIRSRKQRTGSTLPLAMGVRSLLPTGGAKTGWLLVRVVQRE